MRAFGKIIKTLGECNITCVGRSMDKLNNQLDFLAVCDALKTIKRQTLLLNKSRQENSAEHSWHSALTAMVLFEYCVLEDVNLERVIKMIIIHDLVEVYAGDAPAMDKQAQVGKEKREQDAADKLFNLLPAEQAQDLRALWEEFEEQRTNDAQYAVAVDCFQSFHNNRRNKGEGAWTKFNATAEMIRNRNLPIKKAMPSLWHLVESTIEEGLRLGFVK